MDKLSTYVIFCDDVRQEIGGKRSFIGVYGDELYVPTLPALIPKFYIVVVASCHIDNIPKTLSLSFTLGDEVVDHSEMPTALLDGWRAQATESVALESAGTPQAPPARARVMIEFMVSPFVIKGEGWLVACVETEDDLIRVGSLKIVKKENEPTVAVEYAGKHK